MRALPVFTLLLVVALALAGCSAVPRLPGSPEAAGSGAAPTATVAPTTAAAAPTSPAPTPAPTAAPTAAPTSRAAATPAPGRTPAATPVSAAGASPTPSAANDATIAAIKVVIQKTNQAQQEAFARNDPTLMKDTSTSAYYKEMVQINSDMADNGVSAIRLVKIEWGQIRLTGPTAARATTYETWSTTYSDGTTDEGRERNDYTLVQEQGAWKIQADDHPGSNPRIPPGSVTSPGSGVPDSPPQASAPPASGPPASQTGVSRNWSGYAATSGTFTGVTGTWSVPRARSGGGVAGGATWVGIGGVQGRDLIQAGTQETIGNSGTVRYSAWVEMLPQASRPVPLGVSPGDSVTVSINQQASGRWLIEFQNHTTGESYRTTVSYASSLSSAEWVVEAPSVGRRVVPIDDFGTVQFSGGTTVENGKTVTIAQAGAQPITMALRGSGALARPSVLTPDGQGFSVSRTASAPAPGARSRSAS